MKNTHNVLMAILLFFGSGCNNPCQNLCLDIRDFAQDCGEPFTHQDLSECLQNQGKKTKEEKQYCAEASPLLEEKWTCDNLEVFFD